jgi:hypothetical protein
VRDKDQVGGLRKRELLVGVLILGSVWGFIEVVGGGAMKAGGVPYKGDLMTGLGMCAMAIGVAMFRRPLFLIGIAVVAVALRQLAVPILHLSTFCKANSCIAMLLGGGGLAGMTALAGRRFRRGVLPRAATGFLAGLLTGASFYWIGMRVAPCRYLMSFNRPGGFVAFMLAEGLIWAALSGVFVPVGYLLGERLRDRVFDLPVRQPAFYYGVSAVVVACCWAASAIAIAGGM